ncbi:ABC transporter substrate-binding protein [Paenibacillus sp. CGMCC 1.16610]|uniref:Extracellular solute-binding protein n=1 Tax=Paenibacillus anseongense TaxID=2682845 RepID=A0ABW9U5M4_9BACL|nr:MULTISPECIES: ABC transporter substrate-binding protein [Paenibacillus]MBA2942590.1 ABC transporter substrate-binding protein [Paenibacillus sp. CGMCC 1.16610]MVQ35404.1 extracellular solute-binding protein [Paenibacillus anseongense]
MKKKVGNMMVAAVVLTGLLAGCSSNGSGVEGTTAPASTSAATAKASGEPAKGKATVQFWHSLGGKTGEYMTAMIDRFNASHPNIEVVGTFQGNYDETATKLQQSIAANTAPDVTMLERAYVEQFADAEVLQDLNAYMKSSKLSADDFVPGLMGHSTFNNKLVSLPLNRSTPIFYINKDMLDEKGLAVPTTWDELNKVANALVIKEGSEYKRYGLTMVHDSWYPIALIAQAGGKFFNEKATSVDFIDNGIGDKVFSYLKDMQKSGALYYPPSQNSGSIVNQMFTDGKVGMMFQSTGVMGSLSNLKFKMVTAFMPKDKVNAEPTGGANIAMTTGSKQKDAAWEFINWVETDPQGGLQFIIDTGYLPFTKKMVETKQIQDLWTKEPNRKVAYDQLQFAVDTNKSVVWPEVMKEFHSVMQAIMYDSKDIKSSLDGFKKETERILKSK